MSLRVPFSGLAAVHRHDNTTCGTNGFEEAERGNLNAPEIIYFQVT